MVLTGVSLLAPQWWWWLGGQGNEGLSNITVTLSKTVLWP